MIFRCGANAFLPMRIRIYGDCLGDGSDDMDDYEGGGII